MVTITYLDILFLNASQFNFLTWFALLPTQLPSPFEEAWEANWREHAAQCPVVQTFIFLVQLHVINFFQNLYFSQPKNCWFLSAQSFGYFNTVLWVILIRFIISCLTRLPRLFLIWREPRTSTAPSISPIVGWKESPCAEVLISLYRGNLEN